MTSNVFASLVILACVTRSLASNAHASSVDNRIVGGNVVTNRTQFAYQVSVRVQNGGAGLHACGGSIISPRHVLTTAICTIQCIITCDITPSLFLVVAGDLNLANPTDNTVYRNAAAIHIHPDYNPLTHRHDIAVIEVDEEFDIDGVTLSVIPLSRVTPPVNAECVIAGWGITGPVVIAPSDDLLTTRVIIADGGICKRDYDLGLIQYREDHLCATDVDGSSGWCRGDTGGALVCAGAQVAVMSLSNRCLAQDPPSSALYARIGFFTAWIRVVTGIRIP